MSRFYSVLVNVENVPPENDKDVRDALEDYWEFDIDEIFSGQIDAIGQDSISGGISEEGFAGELAGEIFKVAPNVSITIVMSYMENSHSVTQYSFVDRDAPVVVEIL